MFFQVRARGLHLKKKRILGKIEPASLEFCHEKDVRSVIQAAWEMSVFSLLDLENSSHSRRADLAWPGIMARPACRGASNQRVAMRAFADEVGVHEGVRGGVSLKQEWPVTIGLILR